MGDRHRFLDRLSFWCTLCGSSCWGSPSCSVFFSLTGFVYVSSTIRDGVMVLVLFNSLRFFCKLTTRLFLYCMYDYCHGCYYCCNSMTFFIGGDAPCCEFKSNAVSIYNCLLEFMTIIKKNHVLS
ncbi:hypothetical protein V8G54_030019 [Vigna mungo]|uniref:Uncharacterized protein n=1 Tax=Vigna mungo TaxID=3915 RepID=A0AAQ3MVQ0_VIGMU